MERITRPDVVLFLCQVLLIFIVVCVCLINLTFQWGDQNLWSLVLTGCMGYIMPNPKIKLKSGKITEEADEITENQSVTA
jgi:hypothetical protein